MPSLTEPLQRASESVTDNASHVAMIYQQTGLTHVGERGLDLLTSDRADKPL
jgi:hypothetical protein